MRNTPEIATDELQRFKAAFFRALAHPVRIRILELLVKADHTVQELQEALGASQADAKRPEVLASTLVSRLDHQHAFLINRNKLGSMALPGESLFVLEMQPASYAILAVNEAEKAARIKVVDYRMIGATGRVYITVEESDVRAASEAATEALELVG